MPSILIRRATAQDFEPLSELIADQNKTPSTQCIQSDTGSDPRSVQNEMVRLASAGGLLSMLALQNSKIIGSLGCELDTELGRGWTRGPFVASQAGDWETVAAALLQELLSALPSPIHMLDSFQNVANERSNAFYLSHGFQRLRLVHVYSTDARQPAPKGWAPSARLDQRQAQQFISLHDSIFPRTYATGQRILDKLDEARTVFVVTEGDQILGYVYAAIEEDSGEGSVEYIGVREDARGRKLGRQLLQTALHWLFEVKRVSRTGLVVNDDLANARSLYESVGFHLKYTGVHTRREL